MTAIMEQEIKANALTSKDSRLRMPFKKTILYSFLVIASMAVCSCRDNADDEANRLQQEAKAAEPSILNADELIQIITANTTHYKMVYLFSDVCKPCLEHLKNEVKQIYADHDTSEWKIYLVAEFNGLRRMVPDSNSDELVEAPLSDNIKHFANSYRKKLTSWGYNLNDAYFLYDARWEDYGKEKGFVDQILGKGKKTKFDQGIMIQQMFTSDKPFQADNYVPQLLLADPQNHIQTYYTIETDSVIVKDGRAMPNMIKEVYYAPGSEYTLEKFDYRQHDTIYSVRR